MSSDQGGLEKELHQTLDRKSVVTVVDRQGSVTEKTFIPINGLVLSNLSETVPNGVQTESELKSEW